MSDRLYPSSDTRSFPNLSTHTLSFHVTSKLLTARQGHSKARYLSVAMSRVPPKTIPDHHRHTCSTNKTDTIHPPNQAYPSHFSPHYIRLVVVDARALIFRCWPQVHLKTGSEGLGSPEGHVRHVQLERSCKSTNTPSNCVADAPLNRYRQLLCRC